MNYSRGGIIIQSTPAKFYKSELKMKRSNVKCAKIQHDSSVLLLYNIKLHKKHHPDELLALPNLADL